MASTTALNGSFGGGGVSGASVVGGGGGGGGYRGATGFRPSSSHEAVRATPDALLPTKEEAVQSILDLQSALIDLSSQVAKVNSETKTLEDEYGTLQVYLQNLIIKRDGVDAVAHLAADAHTTVAGAAEADEGRQKRATTKPLSSRSKGRRKAGSSAK